MRKLTAGIFLFWLGATAGFGVEDSGAAPAETGADAASLIVLPVIWDTVKNIHYFASGDVGVFVDDVIYTDLNLNRSFHLGERDLRGVRFFMSELKGKL